MPCFHPIKGYRAPGGGPISFSASSGYVDRPITVPCGQCIGCRLERSRKWAVRITHEQQLHEDNVFVTLTYSDEALAKLPIKGSLVKKHFQDFMKRLRERLAGRKIRYFHCGEYGERFGRPHYHAILFGIDFADKEYFRTTRDGHRLYTSAFLDDVWQHGHCQIGSVTFESAAYCARYIMKKVTGDVAESYYEFVDEDGVVHAREPEYCTMSRRPGLGAGFMDKFPTDIYPRDYIVVNGVKCRPPRFYDDRYEVVSPVEYRRMKGRRKRALKAHADNNTPDRLKVREDIVLLKLERLKREVE